jgi:hypothetical protein
MTLTPLEQKVLEALKDNAAGNGGDFGIVEDIDTKVLGINRQQLGGILTTLQAKGVIAVHPAVKVNGEYWVTQFTLD